MCVSECSKVRVLISLLLQRDRVHDIVVLVAALVLNGKRRQLIVGMAMADGCLARLRQLGSAES